LYFKCEKELMISAGKAFSLIRYFYD